MKNTTKRILKDLKTASPKLEDPDVLKRFLMVLALVILSIFAFQRVGGEPIPMTYDFKPDSTSVVLVDKGMKTIRISEDVLDMDLRLKRTIDFICEIDGVKYYMLNKIKL
jgi:hypothetical protein